MWVGTLGRDAGLEQAIERAGGVAALARHVGVSQPAISSWKRVPAERVISVEQATGIARGTLRPDLYPDGNSERILAPMLSPEDEARILAYRMLGALIWRAPDTATLEAVAALRGDNSEFGMARLALADAAAAEDAESLGRRYFALFIGVGRGEFLPYASYYLTGFLHERPLADVRADLARLGLAREERIGEPEDHAAILFDVMAGLIAGEHEAEGLDADTFFQRHIAPWAGRFFADLELTGTCPFYAQVGRAGRLFLEIETEALRLPA